MRRSTNRHCDRALAAPCRVVQKLLELRATLVDVLQVHAVVHLLPRGGGVLRAADVRILLRLAMEKSHSDAPLSIY